MRGIKAENFLIHRGKIAIGKKVPAKNFDAPSKRKLTGSPLLKASMRLADMIPSEIKGTRDSIRIAAMAVRLITFSFI